jgi:hypothetical protein
MRIIPLLADIAKILKIDDTECLTATDPHSCSKLGPTLAALKVNGDQMATRWTFRPSSLTEPGPKLLFRVNGSVVFTKDYVKHTCFSKKTYRQGTSGIITRIHKGPLCGITHLDVRLPKGEFLRVVPIDYFRA